MQNVGNEYQNTAVVFDLVFGELMVPIELPEVCRDLEGIVTKKIEGTSGNDVLEGDLEAELILGYEGDDRIRGELLDDCIIGGLGNDIIKGGSGNDIIDGGEGR
jgi:Ca2+-binding RTX toxin-like protein